MWKKICLSLLAAALLTGSLAACDDSDVISQDPDGKYNISIMTASYNAQSASDDAEENPVIAAVEELTGVDLTIKFTASSNYGEKVTAAMGAGTYPNIMKVPDRTSAIVQNCRGGTFWDITDKIKETGEEYVTDDNPEGYRWPNLAKADEEVLHNMSVDGRVYGLYSSRDLGRNGVTIRKDWLEAIGYDHYPSTLDEFYDVCKKFTENDPDGDGEDNTYGMIMTSYTEPINQIVVWAGAPNGWGIVVDEETGEESVLPSFMWDEYMDGLNFIKDLYDNGYMNKNWATMDSEKWNEPMLTNSGGIIIDVSDRARRNQTNIVQQDWEGAEDAEIGVFGSVAPEEGQSRRVLPTTGYNGFFVFPKASVRTEEELDICLDLMNALESPEVSDLMQYGIEGRHYIINENGEYEKMTDEDGNTITTYDKEFADLNQCLTFINGDSNLDIPYATEVAEEVAAVLDDNAKYTVANPVAPYISKTASLQGTALDDVITEANTKYIKGDIDLEGWQDAVQNWLDKGGDKVIEEYNEAYHEDEGRLTYAEWTEKTSGTETQVYHFGWYKDYDYDAD